MRRIFLAMVMVAMIFPSAAAVTEPASEFVSARSAAAGRPGTANVGAEAGPSVGERVPRGGWTLTNQYGEEIPVGVQGPPPVPFPGAGPPMSDTTTHIHVMRNGQLWTVDVPMTRTPSDVPIGPNADEAINFQLPVMWRCSDKIQSGCWDGPGDPPGNPAIPDRPRP